MDVRVHGKNMQISEELREIATEKVKHAGRIFDSGSEADIEFSEHQNPRISDDKYKVEVTVGVAGQTVRVEAHGHEDRAALDIAVDKFERRLRRLKERLIDRSRKGTNKHLNHRAENADEPTQDGFSIVRTKRFAMKPMTPEEAALQMEMLGHDFFFFLDAESGVHCVLYHRRDGSLGLIEPQ